MDRIIPATMATQHPDNARAPYWEEDGDGYISTREETREAFSAFSDLDCQEYMWDWEGKYVDEAVVDRLFHNYHEYFKKQQLGRDKFLTFRIPNIRHERGYSLARALMGMLTAEAFARDLKLHTPPIFEVILPMTDRAESMLDIQTTFSKLAAFKRKLFHDKTSFDYLNVLPLFEGISDLTNCRQVLEKYVSLHQKYYKRKPAYMRLHIARSDPALNAGVVPAVVAGKVALSEYHQFGRDYKIDIFPAIGVGTLPFRGSLSPERIESFLKEYSGMRTVYIQSAFRYDFPLKSVKAAIKKLNAKLPQTPAVIYTKKEITEAKKICRLFTAPYKNTVESLASTINELAKQVPNRRERKLHIGLFGYTRHIGKKQLPRAIPFTAVLYSLGVPPEFIGTGRGLHELEKSRIDLTKFYRNFKEDMQEAGRYLNKENLSRLARKNSAWKKIQHDVDYVEQFLGEEIGPKTHTDFIHRNSASNTYHLWKAGESISEEMIVSGKLRKSLG